MAWKPPEDELDQNLNQQWEPPKNELDWKPPEEELDNSLTNIKDVGTLQQMKESGQPLTREQERILWDANKAKPLTQKASKILSKAKTFTQNASEVLSTAFPVGAKALGDLAVGSGELALKGLIQPLNNMFLGSLMYTPEQRQKILRDQNLAYRALAAGGVQGMEELFQTGVKAANFGTSFTDKLQGLSEDEQFNRYMLREYMSQEIQKAKQETPDALVKLAAESPLIQGVVTALAGLKGVDKKAAIEDYKELMLEQGLTEDQLKEFEKIALVGDVAFPLSLPGTNRLTRFLGKPIEKATQKTGELALKAIKPIAELVEGGADLTLKGTELIQGGAKKLGEYTVNDQDTWFKTTANTIVTPVNLIAKPTRSVARVVKDVTAQADVGGAAGRRGLFERAGRAGASSDITRRLFGPQGKGGVARAKVADWTVRQANAIIQPGVNGAALNVLMGLPDIETTTDLGHTLGTGFGIGAFGGARVFDRAGAIIDPRTSLAEKITTVVTPDMAQRRLDEDADIKRFIATATPEMKSQMADLSNIDKRKTAIDSKLINLRQQKERTINAADEANLQRQIDGFEKQRQALEKATPQTVREAERQVQLAFLDAMDLAQATGTSAGLRGLNLTVLNADNAEGFFRNLYGGAVERAEGVVNLLTGRTDLTMEESQNLQQARELLNRFSTEVAGAKNQRGFAIGVDGTDPNAEGYVAPHLRKVNQTGATAVINGDLVKHLSEQGFDVRRVINHEMQHALQQFREVKKMLAPIRGDLFDQKVVKDDGTVEVWKEGIFSDADIARYGANYAAKMSPADNGASFIAQFQDVDAFTAYIKDEILAEVASQTGDYSNGTRAALDDVGRNLVDWLEVKTKAGALRKMKEGLRTFGIVFDNYGGYSNVLGADLPPQALAMMRQYQRQLRDFDGSMQIQTTREEDAPDIPMTAILGSRALQEKYKDADFFEKEQILRSTAPDGSVTEIVMPKGAKLDPFVDIYRIQGGQLVDANGNPVQLPPEITFGSLPEGSTFQMDTRIARKSDGSPITLSPREIKSRALERTQSIRNVIDSAPDDGTPNRLIDTGNGNYRGVMSPSQLAAVLSIPNNVLAPALKRQIQFFNELMQRGDGTRAIFEYQAAVLNGKYKAIAPKIRDEVPIGWQFTKDGNFALTTMSVSRLYDKLQAWADQGTVTQEQTWTGELIPVKRSKNLALWNGDTNKFWNSLVQVLDNHANGREGWVGLHSDELTAKRMRNKVNDLFNVFNKETKEMNPDRSTLPRVRGRDNVDIIVRSRRVDRINSFSESPSTKVPVNYGKLLINYMPETNPLAAPQTPEQFMENINGSVSATRIRNAIATGAVDQLESELRNSDDLLPTESLFVSQGEGGDPVIQVTSMLDPNVEGALEPEEVVVDLDARTAEELARLEAEEAAAMAAQQQAPVEPAPEPTTQFMPAEGDFEQIRRDAIDKRNKRRDEAYEILYSVIPETADILKRKINFEDDQQEFNSIPFSMPSVGFDYDRSFHLTKIVRRILDTLDPMADTKAIQNLRRKWDTASPIDKQDIEDRIKKYEDRIKKTASTMKYAFGVFADLTASLPEAKARDLRQDKIVDPWVVLKKHFPDGESKDINKVILELRDIIKFGTEKENFKSSINNVLNAAEILRDFTDVDQSVIDQLFKDRYNKSEAQIKKDEEEFFKEVTNPEFYNVEKRGTATFSQKIEPQGGIQFMPAVAAVPERFTGKPEDERRGRYVAPPAFFQQFDIGEYERGGKFFDIQTGEDVTDKIYATGTIDVTGKSPSLVSDVQTEQLGEGKTWKTNLFKKSAGWNWISENPPEVASIGKKEKPDPVLVSVENGKDHFYALKVDFPAGVKLQRYSDKPSEPRLRPTAKGEVQFGNEIGRIKTAKKEHPVYDTITIGQQFMPAEQGPLADIQAPEQTKTEPLVPKTLQTDAGDFSVVIGGKPGKYGFGYTTVTELQPKLELSQQRKKELLETLTPRNDELSKKRDALLDVGNTWWENDDLIAKPNRNEEDMKRLKETSQFLQEFMAKEDKEFTLDDAIQVAQVNRLTKKINELQKQLTPAPFKFPADRDVALKSLQSTVATIFKTKKFKDFIEGATGVSNIQFNNIFGTWKFDPEPSFVFSAPGMTWEQSQVVTKWLSFLMTQDAGIAWKPSIGLTEGVSSVYLIHDKKLTEAQILKAFEKAKEVGIDGLSLTVDGKGIKGANFDGIEGFYDKLAEIQKAAGIKNAHETLVDSFYYDTTSDFTAEDGSTRVPDWLKGESINEKNTQDQQGGSDETGGIGGDNTSTRGLTILLRRGIDSVLVPYAKALAGEGFIFDPDLFAQRYGLGQEVADYIREQLYPKKGLSRSVTPILEGTEKFVVPESFYTKDGKLKTSVNDLMYALQRRSADDGFIAPGDYSPQAGKIISETIVDEVLGHIERAKKNPNAPNAIGWYDAALKRMKKEYAKYFPFLNRNSKDYNPDKEFVFDSVLGITSQGNNVFENGKMAARVQFLLENGKTLPEVVADLYDTFGGQTRAIENNLLKLDQLLKNNETQTLDKIFRKKMTVSEWNAYLKKNKNLWYDGKPLSVDGQADQMVTGFSVFGPKIGSFINNLHGDYSTLTADLWFTRTWNRILGNVFQHASLKEANQYDSFRDALIEQYRKYLAKNYAREFKPLVKKTKKDGEEKTFEYRNEPELDGLSEMDFAELINDPQKLLDFATTLEDRFRTGQYKQKSDLRRAAKNWVENRSDPVAAPRTDLERDFQQNVMEIAQKKLRKMGIDISIADMQAALWYNEKELFGLYGAQVSGAEPADYADSAENVSELLSYGTLFQLERQVEQADGTKKKEIIRLVPYDAELGLTKIENAKTPDQYSRLVAARKKAADDAKKAGKKLEKAEAKVEEKTQELARINPADEKAKQKAESELAKAKQVLADLKLPATDAPLTEIKPPLE